MDNKTASRKAGFTLAELMLIMLVIGILMTILVPTISAIMARGYRTGCANNVRELARGCVAYAGDSTLHRGSLRGALPCSATMDTSNWGNLVGNFDALGNGNAAGLWLLIHRGYAARGLFLCPSAEVIRSFDKPGAADNNFTPTTLSYSYLSMIDYPACIDDDEGSLIILSDQNPRCTLGVTGITTDNDENSKNHDGDGQNVGSIGGTVEWVTKVDPDGDDIYAAESEGSNEANGQRGLQDDVFLIP